MLGDFATTVLVLTVGYVYPAFECFKIIKKDRPEMEKLRFWCQYWIIVALLTAFERIADMLISWFPLHGEVKLLFMLYLWHPKTEGTCYIYNNFIMPFIVENEIDIEKKLHEMKDKASDLLVLYIKNFSEKGQSLVFDILHNVVAQSPFSTKNIEHPQPGADSPASYNKKNQKVHGSKPKNK